MGGGNGPNSLNKSKGALLLFGWPAAAAPHHVALRLLSRVLRTHWGPQLARGLRAGALPALASR